MPSSAVAPPPPPRVPGAHTPQVDPPRDRVAPAIAFARVQRVESAQAQASPWRRFHARIRIRVEA